MPSGAPLLPKTPPRLCAAGFIALCVGLAATTFATGCAKSLFPSDMPRNQFETHDRMRQAYTPLEEPDVFGTPQPALRARLTQQPQQ
ncbi:MAG: hypothetical protein LW806_02935 [Planctomycetaceae bacterium]|nr:hypothetical protein [Planctomycetaceae bacterium]